MKAFALLAGCLMLASCGAANDYATIANAAAEEGLRNTTAQLSRKHDTELRAYMAVFCGEPRAGALRRAFGPSERETYFTYCTEMMDKNP